MAMLFTIFCVVAHQDVCREINTQHIYMRTNIPLLLRI